VFSIGLLLFTLALIAYAAATSPGLLVGARLAQGLAAALVSPQVLSIIGIRYTGPGRLRALSIYAMVMGLGAVSGQLIGGLLIRADLAGLGWRSIFLLNVPLALAALALVRRLVPESRAENPSRLDLPGVLLVTGGLMVVVLPLVQGRQYGWPAGLGSRSARHLSSSASSRHTSCA
jgi:MFS family permease